jgi:hypothetical protein
VCWNEGLTPKALANSSLGQRPEGESPKKGLTPKVLAKFAPEKLANPFGLQLQADASPQGVALGWN